MASGSKAISCSWADCAAPDLRRSLAQVLHCGPALPDPLLSSYGLPKVRDLPAVEQGLSHDLLVGHALWADQPVGMQLPGCLQEGHDIPRGLDALMGKLEKSSPLSSCHKCWDCAGAIDFCSAVRGMASQLLK